MTMNRNQYPCVEFDLDLLAENLAALVERCHDSLIEVAGVVKAVSSLPKIVRVYEESGVKFIATSRISQMRAIREAGICKKPLMLIRIPMLSELPDVVELCDISLQSDIIVLRALNEEAKKQGKVHEVILMMDLGDLREGFWNEEDALDAALEIEHELKNLRLAGVGVNLSCYGSVTPNKRNMQGLVSLASDIEREIGRKLDYISGGASTSAYMAMNGTMPYRINLLRLGDIGLRGETDNFAPDFLETGVMTIKAEVIECRDKPSFPVGELSVNAFGEVGHYEDRGIRRRALVAMGRVDYGNCFDLVPRMEGIEVIGDIPMYVSDDSADAWSEPENFWLSDTGKAIEISGAPPDNFAPEGQVWGNPTFRWDHMKESGYRWWLDRLRRAFALYDRVRLDHFLGFHNYFSILAGKACADGRWLAGPGKDLFQTAYDELGPLNFIAEDLGYLTPGVRAMASTCGFPGMDVLEFSDYDVRCGIHPTPGKILYTSTHDTSTLAGWCTRSFAGGDEPSGVEVAAKLMGDALASDAPLVMMPLQDVLGLGDDARMNVPGVATGNWTWQAQEADIAEAEEKTAKLLRSTHRFWGEA